MITTDIDEDYEHNVLLALSGVLIKEKDGKSLLKPITFLMIKKIKKKKTQEKCGKVFCALNIDCKYWVNKANKWVLARSS